LVWLLNFWRGEKAFLASGQKKNTNKKQSKANKSDKTISPPKTPWDPYIQTSLLSFPSVPPGSAYPSGGFLVKKPAGLPF